MNIHYALYDPSYPAPGGGYWTWRSSKIYPRELDSLYYDFLRKNLAESPNSLTPRDLHGGAVVLPDWLVVYRFFNGGRDTHNRPGRYVILTGWIPRNETPAEEILSFWELEAFQELAQTVPPCPVPEQELEEHLPAGRYADFTSAAAPKPGLYPPGSSVTSAMRDILALSIQGSWKESKYHLTFHLDNQNERIELHEIKTPPKPTPKSDFSPTVSSPKSYASYEEKPYVSPKMSVPARESRPMPQRRSRFTLAEKMQLCLIALVTLLACGLFLSKLKFREPPKTPPVHSSTAISPPKESRNPSPRTIPNEIGKAWEDFANAIQKKKAPETAKEELLERIGEYADKFIDSSHREKEEETPPSPVHHPVRKRID